MKYVKALSHFLRLHHQSTLAIGIIFLAILICLFFIVQPVIKRRKRKVKNKFRKSSNQYVNSSYKATVTLTSTEKDTGSTGKSNRDLSARNKRTSSSTTTSVGTKSTKLKTGGISAGQSTGSSTPSKEGGNADNGTTKSKTTLTLNDQKAKPLNNPGGIKTSNTNTSTTFGGQRQGKTIETLKKVVLDDDTLGILHIGYSPHNGLVQKHPWAYPYVKMPKPNSVIRIPRERRRQLRGYTEDGFQKRLERAFSLFGISGNHCLPTSAQSRPYEPDISLIVRENNVNLFINIEIDEPYAGIKRTPMHCLGYDDLRDAYFTDRGWMIIRFTEKQIHLQPENCISFIARVIKSVYPNYSIPVGLNLPDPEIEQQWTSLQAQKWSVLKYRESYLGIPAFGKIELTNTDEAVVLSEQDLKVEGKVESSIIIKPESKPAYVINMINGHPRDKRIHFIEDGHTYLIDGVHARSVTEMIDGCFPIFDSEYWATRKARQIGCDPQDLLDKWEADGQEAQSLGTKLHDSIEKHYHGVPFEETTEFNYFLNFHQDHFHLKPYRTEWRVFDEHNLVAGTIDMIVDNKDGSYDIYDWKRSKKVVDSFGSPVKTDSFGKTGLGVFSHIHDTSYNRYCLQQNVYKMILEKHYGKRIRNMYLVVIHPTIANYRKVAVTPMKEAAEQLISINN